MGESHGLVWETFVLLTGYCALRISEALDVRLDSFEKRNGRWWLNVATQEHRAVAACSDTGATKERMRTKSRVVVPGTRLVPYLTSSWSALKLTTVDVRDNRRSTVRRSSWRRGQCHNGSRVVEQRYCRVVYG